VIEDAQVRNCLDRPARNRHLETGESGARKRRSRRDENRVITENTLQYSEKT